MNNPPDGYTLLEFPHTFSPVSTDKTLLLLQNRELGLKPTTVSLSGQHQSRGGTVPLNRTSGSRL